MEPAKNQKMSCCGKLRSTLVSIISRIVNLEAVSHGVNDPNSSHYLKSEVYTKTESNANYEPKNANIQAHIADVTTNPHHVTLEQARSQNNTLAGDINMATNRIRNVPNAIAGDEPINKTQFDSIVSAGRNRGQIDCSTNPNYPASDHGDRWEVTVAGKIGGAAGIDVEAYDEIVCQTASAAGNQATVGANFYIVQGNLMRATETTGGYSQIATDAEVSAGTDNYKYVTSLKLATWWTAIKAGIATIGGQWTFTLSPVFSALTANQTVETDGSKKLITAAKGTAYNKNYGSIADTVTEGNDPRLFQSGDVKVAAYAAVPTGWLLCDGSAVSRTTYAALFTAIGTSYGVGNGTTTFNVPTLDDARFMMFGTVGITGGANTINLQHNHTTTVPSEGAITAIVGGVLGSVGQDGTYTSSNALSSAQDIRPKYSGFKAFIKI